MDSRLRGNDKETVDHLKMKQFVFQIIGLMIVIIAGFYFTSKQSLLNKNTGNPPQTSKYTSGKQLKIIDPTVVSGDAIKTTVNIEIADTKEKRAKGLGGRQSLASDSGMLFIFNSSNKYTFWMKGLIFPLDLVWIQNDEIAEITQNIPSPQLGRNDESLPRFSPKVDVNKVLEVNGGFVMEHDVKVGDRILVTGN